MRLSPLPFSPTPSSDGQAPPLTSPLPLLPDEAALASTTTTTTTTTTDIATPAATTTTTTTTTTPVTQPLTVSVADEEEEEDDDEMATRRLSKALSPRSQAAAAAAKPYSPEPVSPPKPAPRQRAGTPTSLSTPRSDSSADDVEDAGQTLPRKAERKMTASEIVAAASRRPSGRGEDLPQPAPVSPRSEVLQKEAGGDSSSGSPRPPPSSLSSSSSSTLGVDPVVAAARSPRGVASPREEVLPVFVETVKKVSPVATPRTRPRSPAEGSEGLHTPRENHHHDDHHHHHQEPAKTEPESQVEGKPEEVVAEVVHAHAVTITQTAPPPPAAAASKAKVPPPVAPKPRRTSSVSSDKSASSAHSDESPKDLPSPTLVSSKLRDFADAGVPTAEEQAQNRKFVSSAARMFERKASESKPVSPLAHGPAKSSVSVSSVVRSFNRDPDPAEPSGRSGGVTMRKISLGVGGGGGADGGRSINSALRPASERRKSMPSSFTGSATPSLSLTKPSHLLSQYRNNPPSSGRGAPAWSRSEDSDAQPENAPRFSLALRPRQHGVSAAAASASSSSSNSYSSSAHNTTSLRSVLASKEHKQVEEQEEEEEEENEEALKPATPPAVGKIAESPKVSSARSDVTLRSRSSVHDSHDASTSRSHKHASWSPQSADDLHSHKMIFTSTALHHHSDRYGSPTSPASPFSSPSSSSSAPWRSDQSDNLESTMKKFDDLLSDKHTFDSDDELPTVSNSVSFDLLKSRSAGKVAASMKTAEEPAAAEVSPRGDSVPAPAVASREDEAGAERSPGEGKSGGSTEGSADQVPAAERAAEEEDLHVKNAPAPSTGEREAAPTAVPEPAKREEEPEKGSEVQTEEEPAESESEIPEAGSERQPLPDAEDFLAEATPSTVVREVPEAKATDSVPSDSGEQGESAERGMADDHVAETSQHKGQSLKLADAEEVGDAYPEEDGAAPLDVVGMAADSYPEEDAAAPMPAAAEETIFQQQASSIVRTVLSNALSDVADMLKRGVDLNVQEEEDDDDDAPPPPLPSEEPPPLPGAPPPPLILRNDAEKLVDAEDLVGMLPSQEAASAKTSPRSSEDRASSAETSPRGGPPSADAVESDDVELDVDDAVKADTSTPSFALPVDQTEEVPVPPPQDVVRNRNDEPQSLTRSSDDVVISFDSAPPSDSFDPLSVNTDLLSGGGGVLRGKDGELEHAHSDNPPVSDTLSQDSGVQDEDMSEDGLRFSQDESPTSNVDSSVFDAALTPDEIPVSVMHGSEEDERAGSEEAGVDAAATAVEGGSPVSAESEEAGVEVDVEHVTVTQSPVPSPRVTLSQARPGAPPSQAPTPAAIETHEVGSPPPTTDAQSVHASLPQDSASPRCSSGPQEAAVSAPPGGASTNGDDGRRAGDSALGARAAEDAAVAAAIEENDVQSFTGRNHDVANDEVEEKQVQGKDRDSVEEIPKSNNINSSSVGGRSFSRAPEPPQSPPPPLPPSTPPQEHVHEEDGDPQEDSSPDSPTAVVSSRKWCILDQSGSLFLHGGSGARVSVAQATLRQVSSLRPAEMASMLEAANRDLDAAKLPKALELRVVSARGLNGRAVKVDVTQREDYFVQVGSLTVWCAVDRTYTHTHTHARTHVHRCTHTHTRTHARTVCTRARTHPFPPHTHTQARTHTHAPCVRAHARTPSLHTHTHTHTHTIKTASATSKGNT